MIPIFLSLLSGGMLAILATGRFDLIAWRFTRNACLIVFAVSLGVSLWWFRLAPAPPPEGFRLARMLLSASSAGACALVFLAPFAERRPLIFRLLAVGAGFSALGGGLLAIHAALVGADLSLPREGLILLSGLGGAALLGSITISWLLGHAYLTATRMTIAPLRHFSRLLSWITAGRIAFVCVSLIWAWLLHVGLSGQVVVLSLRLATGLLAVGVFVRMVSACVKLRSTQSATGILYFGSTLAYIGEISALYLMTELHWPL